MGAGLIHFTFRILCRRRRLWNMRPKEKGEWKSLWCSFCNAELANRDTHQNERGPSFAVLFCVFPHKLSLLPRLWVVIWAQGCVNSVYWLLLGAQCKFTQPRTHAEALRPSKASAAFRRSSNGNLKRRQLHACCCCRFTDQQWTLLLLLPSHLEFGHATWP